MSIGQLGEKIDFVLRQGATFGPFYFEVKNPDGTPVDLSQVEVRGQIRKNPFAGVTAQLGLFKTDPVNGKFLMKLDAETTKNIECGPTLDGIQSQYVYDIEFADGQNVTAFAYGDVKVFREVTK